MKFSNRINQALIVAAEAHKHQTRKGTNIPYIIHPVAVALLISEYTTDEDVIIGALFHDILEDVPSTIYSEEQMRANFGERVTNLVKDVSEPKRPGLAENPWKKRKLAYIEHLQTKAGNDALAISAADKVHNMLSIIEDYSTQGEQLWHRFHAPKKDQLWFYQTVSGIIIEKLGTNALTSQLTGLTRQLRDIVARSCTK